MVTTSDEIPTVTLLTQEWFDLTVSADRCGSRRATYLLSQTISEGSGKLTITRQVIAL